MTPTASSAPDTEPSMTRETSSVANPVAKAAMTFSKVFTGEHVDVDEVTVHRTPAARVEFLGVGGHRAYADGDLMATLPVTVEAVPAAGRYIVPRP